MGVIGYPREIADEGAVSGLSCNGGVATDRQPSSFYAEGERTRSTDENADHAQYKVRLVSMLCHAGFDVAWTAFARGGRRG